MPATVIVNGLTLSHRGSNGMSVATLPDICLTPGPPGPPLPVPYPNIAINIDLMKGTSSVTADGGNMIAIQGSQLVRSTGDEPGVNGGVTSLVNMRETNWLTFSMDVYMEGANACRLSDKQTHNHYNTVNLNGQFEPLSPLAAGDPRIKFLCQLLCICLESPEIGSSGQNLYQACVDKMLQANAQGKEIPGYRGSHYPEITAEQGYDPPQGNAPPSPRSDGKTGYRAPDAIVKKDPSKPATQDNIEYLVEMKFARFGYCDSYKEQQQIRDKEIVGKGNFDKITLLTPKNCGCPSPPGENINRENEGRFAECQDGEEGYAKENTQPGVEAWTSVVVIGGLVIAALLELVGVGVVVAPKPVPLPLPVPRPVPLPPPAPVPLPPPAPVPVPPPVPLRPPAPAPPPPAFPKAAQNDATKPATDAAGVPELAPSPTAIV